MKPTPPTAPVLSGATECPDGLTVSEAAPAFP
jgi:hypothetical protein